MADDPPIVPLHSYERLPGNVVDLAGFRIRAGNSTVRYGKECQHKNLTYAQSERRVWCDDCSRTIDNFDALMVIAKSLGGMIAEAQSMHHKAQEALASTARLRATKVLDKAWSGNTYAVDCPHCRRGLLPEDFANGAGSWRSRELEIAARKKRAAERPTPSTGGREDE